MKKNMEHTLETVFKNVAVEHEVGLILVNLHELYYPLLLYKIMTASLLKHYHLIVCLLVIGDDVTHSYNLLCLLFSTTDPFALML